MSFLDKFKNLFKGNTNNEKLVDSDKTKETIDKLKKAKEKKKNTTTIPTLTSITPPLIDQPLAEPTTIEVPKEDFSKGLVMIDNGHGEDTPGKCSPDKRIREYAYTREIVALLKKELEKENIPYYIVTPETRDVKLKTRVARANKKYEEAKLEGKKAFFISIHLNAAKNGIWYTARGWSAWTSKGQTAGDKLADCLYEAAHEVLDPKKIKIRTDKSDGDEDWESDLYVIKNTNCPACLTESFFQDNKEDVDYLLSDEGKRDVVKIHLEGIKKYIRKYC